MAVGGGKIGATLACGRSDCADVARVQLFLLPLRGRRCRRRMRGAFASLPSPAP